MIRFLIIHHDTSHGITHYETVDAPDRDAAITAFDRWCDDHEAGIFIDCLAALDLNDLSARLLKLIDDPTITAP